MHCKFFYHRNVFQLSEINTNFCNRKGHIYVFKYIANDFICEMY